MRKIVLISPMCNRLQDMRKIVLLSPVCNIWARFVQDCTYFSNAQYMSKICTRLYLFLQCTIYAQDLCKSVLISPMRNICPRFAQDCTYFLQCTIYAQDCTSFPSMQYMCKIVLLSPKRKIWASFAQDCTYFSNVQYMHKIWTRLYLFLQCAIYVQDLCKSVLRSPMCNICPRFA